MAMTMRTPRKTARGLGSAKEGVNHFIAQRVSALALAILVPWFLLALITAYADGYDAARSFVASPVTAVLLIFLLSAAFYHMRLGMQTVIEDYVSGHGTRAAFLILNAFFAVGMWAVGVFAVLKIALGA